MKAKSKIMLMLLLGICLSSKAQNDSVSFNPIFGISDGIYLSYYDFRHGISIKKSDIISNLDTTQIDFISKVLSQNKFQFIKQGQTNTNESKKVWGYFQNNALYLAYNDVFNRVPVFGAISYFVANVKVVSPGYYDPRFGIQGSTVTTTELKEFLMSFYDGSIQEFTMQRAETLMSTDKAFYNEIQKLSSRQKRKQIYSLIRRFNGLHPVFILR